MPHSRRYLHYGFWRAFTAGNDLQDFVALPSAGQPKGQTGGLFAALHGSEKPVIFAAAR